MNSDTPLLSSIRRPNKRLSMAGATRSSLLGGHVRSSGLFDGLNHINQPAVPTTTTNNNQSKRRSFLLSTPASNSYGSNKRRQSSMLQHPPSSSQQSSQSFPNSQRQYLQQAPSASQNLQFQLSQQQPPQQQPLTNGNSNPAHNSAHNPAHNPAPIPPASASGTGVGITQASYIRQDQRPLRDKNYQQLIQQEIYDFLSKNKFELEMNHPLTARTLRQPTQKDFVLIFQFLYTKIDPNYKFTKSIQTEVTSVLKMLNYPYLDGINRSQITAVGGSNWPAILGMLYWLVKLNLSLLNFNEDDLMCPDDLFDEMFVKYIINSYREFINQREDYSALYQELQTQFNQANDNLVQEIDNLSRANQELLENFNQLTGQLQELKDGETKSRALESDLIKFQAYLETMESRKSKWSEILDKIQAEINNCEDELAKIESEKREIEEQLTSKGFTINDIDNLNGERDKLSRSIDLIGNKFEELKSKLQQKDIELSKNFQSLDNFIKQYNNTIFRIPSPSYNFEIELNQDITQSDFSHGFTPGQVINKVLKDEKIELLKYRSSLNTKIHQDQDDAIKLQEQADVIGETISEQQEQVESLGAKLNAGRATYDEIYDSMTSDTTAYSSQIEKLDRELRSIKINTNQGYIEVENRYQTLTIEADELSHEITKQRGILHDKVQQIIEFTISFKINIQQNLEDLDVLVTHEFENEQMKSV